MKINKNEAAVLCRKHFAEFMIRKDLYDNHDLPPESDFVSALDAVIPNDEWETTAWELLDDIDNCCAAVLEMTGWFDSDRD